MKCSRAQWADPEFRRAYYRKHKKKIMDRNRQHYHDKKSGHYWGVFAFGPSFYRHNGNPVWGVR